MKKIGLNSNQENYNIKKYLFGGPKFTQIYFGALTKNSDQVESSNRKTLFEDFFDKPMKKEEYKISLSVHFCPFWYLCKTIQKNIQSQLLAR